MVSRRYSACDRINRIVKELVNAGWEALRCKGHPRIKSPDGKITLTVPGSPSDHRSALNWISQIRRLGVAIPA